MEVEQGGKKAARKTRDAVRTDIQGDETVEEYVLRVCEEQTNELRRHGEAKIQEFIDEAARAKKKKATATKKED